MSSSSEDENIDFLREATDTQFINDGMYNTKITTNHSEKSKTTSKEQLPSLRVKDENDDQFNFLKVTPEFQSYVAKQLCKHLDEQIIYVENSGDKVVDSVDEVKCCVKLFEGSENFIENISGYDDVIVKKVKRKSKYNDVNEVEKVKEAAVTTEFVMNNKEVNHWTSFKKPILFKYRKTKSNVLELIEF